MYVVSVYYSHYLAIVVSSTFDWMILGGAGRALPGRFKDGGLQLCVMNTLTNHAYYCRLTIFCWNIFVQTVMCEN